MNLEKIALRQDLKIKRAALDPALRKEYDQRIMENLFSLPLIRDIESAFCFISYASEVHTHALIDQFLSHQVTVAVPQIIKNRDMKAIRFSGWDRLEKDRMGILSPLEETQPLSSFDITVTPGLGFSSLGRRIGYGRGYYDRWFEQNNGGVKIGLAYEVQLREDIPVDKYDINIDIIVTENRIIKV